LPLPLISPKQKCEPARCSTRFEWRMPLGGAAVHRCEKT
jgi:hypothetical protein